MKAMDLGKEILGKMISSFNTPLTLQRLATENSILTTSKTTSISCEKDFKLYGQIHFEKDQCFLMGKWSLRLIGIIVDSACWYNLCRRPKGIQLKPLGKLVWGLMILKHSRLDPL